jgi:hypothetical protein
MTCEFPSFLSEFLTMPKQLQLSSTACCYCLYEFVETFGEVMVKKCSTCVKHS